MRWPTNFTCEICGKNRGKQFDHLKCSQIRKGYAHPDSKTKPTAFTEKRINKFLKSLGE